MKAELKCLISDERDKPSTARCAFWLILVWTILMITLDGLDVIELSSAAYTLLGTAFTFITVWAAGPRMVQYLGPQIGRAVDAISKAKADSRLPDIRKDDERGD